MYNRAWILVLVDERFPRCFVIIVGYFYTPNEASSLSRYARLQVMKFIRIRQRFASVNKRLKRTAERLLLSEITGKFRELNSW